MKKKFIKITKSHTIIITIHYITFETLINCHFQVLELLHRRSHSQSKLMTEKRYKDREILESDIGWLGYTFRYAKCQNLGYKNINSFQD